MRNLIVCCDGTWNTPDDMDGDIPAPTNVVRLYNSLADKGGNGQEQCSYYHPGVGTEGSRWQRVKEGGLGDGLDKNIKSAYRWLAAIYKPDDAIFLFGFSRGAYTVRSLSGMIARCGLLDAPMAQSEQREEEIWDTIDLIFANYREPPSYDAAGNKTVPQLQASPEMPFHNVEPGQSSYKTTAIHFIGVWDTVGSLGVPDDLGYLWFLGDPAKHHFHDTELGDSVAHARHAVAMDEIRQSFLPTLWTNLEQHKDAKQIWFPGVHSDIGGGYADRGLADAALEWMIGEASAESLGISLAFKPKSLAQIVPDHQGLLHDSVTGVFKTLKTCPRAVPRFTGEDLALTFHDSAIKRQSDPPISTFAYRPQRSLPAEVDVRARYQWHDTGIYLEGGVAYDFTAVGQWIDGTIRCGPAGADDGNFQASRIAHFVGSLAGKLEPLLQLIPRNENADAFVSKRVDEYPWFSLVGVVANGYRKLPDGHGPLDPKGVPIDEKERDIFLRTPPHETFLIGESATFTPRIGGYLLCFANDAWYHYENNRGSVHLTVKARSLR